jgi:hypothetical protein
MEEEWQGIEAGYFIALVSISLEQKLAERAHSSDLIGDIRDCPILWAGRVIYELNKPYMLSTLVGPSRFLACVAFSLIWQF